MGVHEVTQAEYERVMGNNPSWFSGKGQGAESVKGLDTKRFPVERVSYADALEFCKRLGAKREERNRTYRLPTEAEWEYACRAGTKTAFHYGDNLSGKQANVEGEGDEEDVDLRRTCEVGNYKPNAFGLHDMHGNVCEWCSDWYAEGYGRRDVSDPKGPSKGSERVMRGGGWAIPARNYRSAVRGRCSPGNRDFWVGFRVVLAP